MSLNSVVKFIAVAMCVAAAHTSYAIDAGLNMTWKNPSSFNGTTRNILNYGATSNNSSNDDATAIQNAINASSSGDIVYIPNGRFDIKKTIYPKSGVAIHGQSRDNAKIYTKLNSGDTAIRVYTTRNNIELKNFTIRYSSGNTLKYPISIGSTSGSRPYRIRIKNLRIKVFERYGIVVRNARHIKIEDCRIHDATNLGGGGNGYGINITNGADNCWLDGNTLYGLRHGVIVQFSAHHNLIEHNTAYDCTYDCFDLHGEDEYSNELRYNTARDSDRGGFGVGNTGSTHDNSGPNNWIHTNTIYRCKTGIEIILGSSNQLIQNNNIDDCTDYGIRVYNGGGDNLDIIDNDIDDCRRGIHLESADNAVVDGNSSKNNTDYGIRVTSNCNDYTITNNNFSGNDVDLDSSDGLYSGNID
jgi:parallel beta-helix repeat protein